jgi:hypothetical protein
LGAVSSRLWVASARACSRNTVVSGIEELANGLAIQSDVTQIHDLLDIPDLIRYSFIEFYIENSLLALMV